MAETLDTVAFDLDGNLAPIRAKYAALEAQTAQTAASIKTQMAGAFATDTSAASTQALAANLGLTNYLATLNKLPPAHAALAKEAQASNIELRETARIGDELVTGRFAQLPFSIGVLGAKLSELTLGEFIVGGAAIGIGAAFVTAAIQAEQALGRINLALARTANASGVTSSQLRQMAIGLSSAPGSRQSEVGAEAGLIGLVSRGNVPAALLPSAEQAAAGLAEVSPGEKFNKVVAEFEKDLAEPAKGAAALNDAMKLLDAAQTRQVDDLVATGRSEEAQKIIIDAMNERTKEASASLDGISRALQAFGQGLQNFWHNFGVFVAGEAAQTPAEQLAANQARIRSLQADPHQMAGVFPGFGGGAAEIAQLQARDAALQARIAAEQGKAASQSRIDALDQEIQAGEKLDAMWDVAGRKVREHSQSVQQLTRSLAAARSEVAGIQAGTIKGDIGVGREIVTQLQTELRNAQDPNYNPNRGVPKAKGPKDATIEAEAATAQELLRNKQEVAAADERDRTILAATLKAQLDYNRAVEEHRIKGDLPKVGGALATIRDTAIAAAQFDEIAKRHDALVNIQADAAAERGVAQATELSAQAAIDAKISGEAYRAFIKGSIDDEHAYAQALHDRAIATEEAADAQKVLAQQRTNEGLGRIVATGGDPSQVRQAQAINEALAATQTERDTARSREEITLANQHLFQLRDEYIQRDLLQRQEQDDKTNIDLQTSIQLLQAEAALKYADVDIRTKALADLRAEIELKKEGWSVDEQGYAAALAARERLNELQGAAQNTATGVSDAARLTTSLRDGIENLAITGIEHFHNLRQAAQDFAFQIGNMILKFAVLDPLLNATLGTGANGTGGLVGAFFSRLEPNSWRQRDQLLNSNVGATTPGLDQAWNKGLNGGFGPGAFAGQGSTPIRPLYVSVVPSPLGSDLMSVIGGGGALSGGAASVGAGINAAGTFATQLASPVANSLTSPARLAGVVGGPTALGAGLDVGAAFVSSLVSSFLGVPAGIFNPSKADLAGFTPNPSLDTAFASAFGGGRASGGFIDPAKFYVTGEHGPEVFAPGVPGQVHPITAPKAETAAPPQPHSTVNFNYAIDVSGNGDQELMGRMQSVAASTVRDGLAAYDNAAGRTLRARFINSNKRAFV